MRFLYKRIIFYALLIASVAGFVGVTPIALYEAILRRPNHVYSNAFLLLLDVMFIFSLCFFAKYISNRKKAQEFFYKNQPLLKQSLHELSNRPIACITSCTGTKTNTAPISIQKNGLYFLPDVAASKEDIIAAVATATRLFNGVQQTEMECYPDYSESTLNLSICKKGLRIWIIQVKSVGWGAKQTLFFSPDGKTRELERVAFFPPKKIAENWFV